MTLDMTPLHKAVQRLDEGMALTVVGAIPDFLVEARHLLAQLQQRVASAA
jgi:hypothetical protein